MYCVVICRWDGSSKKNYVERNVCFYFNFKLCIYIGMIVKIEVGLYVLGIVYNCFIVSIK